MPVDDQVGEQATALAGGQATLEPLAIAFDDEHSADLDADGTGGRRRHSPMVAVRSAKRLDAPLGTPGRGDGSDDSVRVRLHCPEATTTTK